MATTGVDVIGVIPLPGYAIRFFQGSIAAHVVGSLSTSAQHDFAL